MLACGWTLLTPVESSAAIFGSDDRVTVPPSATGRYAPIGIIRHKGRRATGFLVSRCEVLTVKHVLKDVSHSIGERVRFDVPTASTDRQSFSFGLVIASGPYGPLRRDRTDDWMLIRLDRCLGELLGYVRLSTASPFVRMADGQVVAPVSLAGFPADRRQNAVSVDQSCKIIRRWGGEWRHDCATLPGNSGSPLFREVRNGSSVHLEVVAMVTAGAHWRKPVPFDATYLNMATPVTALVPIIEKAVGN